MKIVKPLLAGCVVLFAAIFVGVIPSTALADITYVGDIGSNTIKNSSVADLVVTTTASVAAGDAIIIAYGSDPSQDLNIAITDDAGNTYQRAAMAIMVGSMRAYIFAAYNVSALSSGSHITITQTVYSSTAVAARAAVVSVFRGLASSGALEQTCVASGTSTSPSSGAATTIQANQLLIGAVGTEGPGTDAAGTWSNSFTAGPRAGTTATTTDAEITISMGWQIVSAAGSYTAAKTGITSRDWAAAIATFKDIDAGISFIGNIALSSNKTTGTILRDTTTADVAVGDHIIVVFAADEEGTVSSVSDDAGNTYTQAVQVVNDQTGTAAGVRCEIFAAYVTTALPSGSIITIDHASVTARSSVASVFRGLVSSSWLDQTHTATGTTSAVSSGATSTTAQAYELLIGGVGIEGPNVDAPSVWQNSFTYGLRRGTIFGASSGDATDITAQLGWRIVGATGTYQAQLINLNTTRDWAAAIATFKTDQPLPVTFATFAVQANPAGLGIRLDWTTVSEVNNYGFYVQRREGSVGTFVDLPNGFVPGHGSTLQPQTYSYVDNTLARVGKYSYRLRQVDLDGTEHFTEEASIDAMVESVIETAPREFRLLQNYPNPFNPTTEIKFSLQETGNALLEVYNLMGQKVATIYDGIAEAGRYYSLRVDGAGLASGLYFYRLSSGTKSDLRKMLLVR